MKRPEFTKEELFIINYYLANEFRLQDNVIASQLGYVTPSCVIFVLGIHSEIPLVSVIGFLLILIFLIWNSWRGLRWERVYRGIFLKYESVFDSPNNGSPSAKPDG